MEFPSTLSLYLWHTHEPPYVIHKSLYTSERTLNIYRCISTCFFISIIIWMLSDMGWKYFVFLTNWGFSIGFLFFLTVTIENFFVQNRHSLLWKVSHVIFEVAITIEFVIVAFYWTALFYLDYADHKNDSDFSSWLFNDICIHFIGFCLLWLDNTVNHIQIFRKHFIFVIIIAICYGVVNCLYTLNVENIYPPITWVDYLSYVCGLILLVLLILHHYFAVWFFERIKKKKIEKLSEQEKNEKQEFVFDTGKDSLL